MTPIGILKPGSDMRQALAYATWRVEQIEVPLPAA